MFAYAVNIGVCRHGFEPSNHLRYGVGEGLCALPEFDHPFIIRNGLCALPGFVTIYSGATLCGRPTLFNTRMA